MIYHTKTKQLSDNDLSIITAIYKKVFSAPPRTEIINEEEIKNNIISDNHFISLLYIDGIIEGFAFSTDISFFKDNHLLNIQENAVYFSEFALSENIRGKGFGKQLLKAHLNYLKLFYSLVYTRSRIDIKNVVKLYLNEGFEIINEYTTVTNQEVSKKYIYKKEF